MRRSNRLSKKQQLEVQNVKFLVAKNEKQKQYIKLIKEKTIVFAIGEAGTGKSFVPCSIAITELKANRINKIVLLRPAVEADENLGFLPGDLNEKITPYMLPIYNIFKDYIDQKELLELIKAEKIEIIPFAFLRGHTLKDCIVLVDEAENCTHNQLKNLLTRLGSGAKILINGDVTQCDLPHHERGALEKMINKLCDGTIDEIGLIVFDRSDIVRHPLITKILDKLEYNITAPKPIRDSWREYYDPDAED